MHVLKGWILALLVGVLLMSGSPAWGIALGDPLPLAQLRQGSASVWQANEAGVTVRAMANDKNQVFAIQVQSQAATAPDPDLYLGEYASFGAEIEAVVPLRGRVVRYRRGEREARWSVFGMSGDFSAEALSLDLAPPELRQSLSGSP